MKHDPDDPGGEYYRDPRGREHWELEPIDSFCAEEGHVEIGPAGEDQPSDVFMREITVADAVVRCVRDREIIGNATYGRPLTADTYSLTRGLKETRDELLDAIFYITALLERLESDDR